jgi:hypothetical protein
MTDLFGEWVSFELLDQLFAVFALRSNVTWQLLTKRPDRMLEYLQNGPRAAWHIAGENFPLKNVWLGVSAEDQKNADLRIPMLLKTPAAIRFVSYEPALGPDSIFHCTPRREIGEFGLDHYRRRKWTGSAAERSALVLRRHRRLQGCRRLRHSSSSSEPNPSSIAVRFCD